MSTYQLISDGARAGRKQLCLLIDPDKYTPEALARTLVPAKDAGADLVFIGGSLLVDNRVKECVQAVKEIGLPAILFPGSPSQIEESADAILFLSLISGRNADLLIGRHVEAAPLLRKSGLEIIPTGYMLVDSGRPTTASYISNTFPLPYDKPDIAACTAMAGEMLGLKLIYLDGGSGAQKPVSAEMIGAVKSNISVPLVVGGGIRTSEQVQLACQAGADVVVVGNAVEGNPELLYSLGQAIIAPA